MTHVQFTTTSPPSLGDIRSRVAERTGLAVELNENRSMPLFKFFLPVENAPGHHEVEVQLNDNQIMVLGYHDHLARCPGYYHGAVVMALMDLGGNCADEQPDYVRLSWAEWCKLNGEPFPPRWKVQWWIAKQIVVAIFIVPIWVVLAFYRMIFKRQNNGPIG
jgi:hypothetical protein